MSHNSTEYLQMSYTRRKGGSNPTGYRYQVGDLIYTLQTAISMSDVEWAASTPVPSAAVTGLMENITSVDAITERCTIYLPVLASGIFVRMNIVFT